jgi:nucleoside-diphosphate-sugar epimerase
VESDLSSFVVFGASGVIGEFLLPQLAARGRPVVAISRGDRPSAAAAANIEWLRGDLCGAVPALPHADVIFSLGPLDAFAAWFAHAAPAQARRVVAFSSMSAESKRDSVDAAERDLSERLRAAEALLADAARERGIACTIFRPTLIYGTGRDRSLAPIARLARRWRVLPIPRGADGLRQPVHAADLAAACFAAVDNESTFGKVYSLGGGERLRFDALLARIAAGPPRLALGVPVPLALVRACAGFLRVGTGALARLRVPLIADNAAAERDFGYAPRMFHSQDVLGSTDSPIVD